MKKVHLTTPGLVKKVKAETLEKDEQVKKLLFSSGTNNNDKKTSNTSDTGLGLLKVFSSLIILIVLFVGINIKFGLYEKFSSFLLPRNQDYTTGFVSIASINTPVDITLNNNNLGQTPIKEYELPPGNYLLTASSKHPLLNNYKLQLPVTIVGKNLTLVQVQLGPSFRTSSYAVIYATPSTQKQLLVFTYKPGVKVYLNDKFIGNTPLNYANVDNLINAKIKLVQEGYLPLELDLVFSPESTLHVEAKLHQKVLNLPEKPNANH